MQVVFGRSLSSYVQCVKDQSSSKHIQKGVLQSSDVYAQMYKPISRQLYGERYKLQFSGRRMERCTTILYVIICRQVRHQIPVKYMQRYRLIYSNKNNIERGTDYQYSDQVTFREVQTNLHVDRFEKYRPTFEVITKQSKKKN